MNSSTFIYVLVIKLKRISDVTDDTCYYVIKFMLLNLLATADVN